VSGPFIGVVLVGGKSERMGEDKAFVEVEGVPMVARVAAALRGAGAASLICVGGATAQLRRLGLDPVPDEHPGEGPLGGLVTGLEVIGPSTAFVAACDLPWLDAATVTQVLAELEASDADVAAPVVEGQTMYLSAAYRAGAAATLRAAFDAGERAVHRAASSLRLVTVGGVDPAVLRDVDTPEDLAP
jgi:molybdopterin-guanine dinucleotide biosynthesis protein A